MTETEQIIAAWQEAESQQTAYALATVIQVNGSAYRRAGAKMLMFDNGRWHGAISGGCLEGDALRKAREVMRLGIPRIVRYDTINEESAKYLGIGLGCEGIIDVLIEPQNDTLTEYLQFLEAQIRAGTEALVTTQIDQESHRISRSYTHIPLGSGKVNTYSQEQQVHIFHETIRVPIHLFVYGAGLDAIPVVTLAKSVGWEVTVNDDCAAHLIPKRFACADDMICGSPDAVIKQHSFHYRSAALLISHNFEFDQAALKSLLPSIIPYIGILGPKKRAIKLLERLEADGFTLQEPDLERIYAPVGLHLGAESAQEIAVSIVAEIMAFFQGGTGAFLKNKKGRIHEHIR